MDFGSVLLNAWKIIWKHKILWIFGILASCGSVNPNSGGSRVSYQGELPAQVSEFFQKMPDWQFVLLVLGIVAVIFILVILAVFLSTIGRIGMIRGTMHVDSGTKELLFGELFKGSMPYFWRVFGLNLLVGLMVFVIAVGFLVYAIIATISSLGLALICLIPSLCLIVPIMWFIEVLITQSSIAMVVDNLGILEGLARGWKVIWENIGVMAVMALILILGVSLAGGLIIGLPFFAVFGAVFANLITLQQIANRIWLFIALLIVYLPVMICLAGILRSYTESAWTLTYLRLTGRKVYEEPAPLEPLPAVPTPDSVA